MIYENPLAKVVGVKLSSWPVPQEAMMLAATLQLFDACAAFLVPGAAGSGHPALSGPDRPHGASLG
jgi:hypothetical protein